MMKKMLMLALVGCGFAGLAVLVTPLATAQAPPKPIQLFESANLDDWDFFLDDPSLKKSDVWEFREGGILYCGGMPFGWLATKTEYKNFHFAVDYRWPPGVEPTNSGIFLRITGKPMTLPQSFECQLMLGKAGDLYGFDGRRIVGSSDRSRQSPKEGAGDFFAVAGYHRNEKPAGEWNQIEVVCQDGVIVVGLNGQIVNWSLDADAPAGKLGLQSEGGPIEFRNATLVALP